MLTPSRADANEIPAAQHLLHRLDLDPSLVTADAMHTQCETGRIVVQEKGGGYLFTVKGNEKGGWPTTRASSIAPSEPVGRFFPLSALRRPVN